MKDDDEAEVDGVGAGRYTRVLACPLMSRGMLPGGVGQQIELGGLGGGEGRVMKGWLLRPGGQEPSPACRGSSVVEGWKQSTCCGAEQRRGKGEEV